MNWFTSRTCGPLILGSVLGACGGGGATPAPTPAVPRPAMTYVSSVLPAGATCPNGGVQLFSGFDDNGNGVLEASEIDATEHVCHGLPGLDGKASLVLVTTEPAGQRCAAEGLRFDQGLDDDRDGTLDPAEIDTTSYVCNGRAGVVAT